MSGPPSNVEPSQLWAQLQEPRPFKIVDFPRRKADGTPVGKLAVRTLTQLEQMACTRAANEVARKHIKDSKGDDLAFERLFSDAICVEVLFRACRDADDVERPAFPTPGQMQEMFTTEECASLFQHYLTVQLELGPLIITMSDEEMEAWIDRLVEGGSMFPFDLLSSDLQKLLLMHMAYQLRPSPTDKSSAGSPAASILSSSEPEPPAQ